MTEATGSDRPAGGSSPDGVSAGARLKAAREARGLHVVNLAVALKVPPRKLEALEADRWPEVGDTVFVRALAQAVCRQLGVDPQPVLERLPKLDRDPVQSFAESPVTGRAPQEAGTARRPISRHASTGAASGLESGRRQPAVVAAALILAAAAGLYVWTGQSPQDPAVPAVAVAPASPGAGEGASAPATATGLAAGSAASAVGPSSAPSPAAPAATAASAVSASAPALVVAAPPSPAASGAAANGAPAAPSSDKPAGPTGATASVGVSTQADSWVQVRDGRGELLLSRIVRSGERVELPAVLPAQVVIGNAAGTLLTLRGQPVDLAAATRDNVTRIELR